MSISLGSDNKFFGATITAREEDSSYPASNLGRGKLFPAHRTADRAMVFAGSTGIFIADNVSLTIIEGIFEVILTTGSDVSTTQALATKWGASGQRSFLLQIVGSQFQLRLSADGSTIATYTADPTIAINTAYKISFTYTEITAVVTASINNVSVSVTAGGTPLSPSDTIFDSTANFSIGQGSTGAGSELTADISSVAVNSNPLGVLTWIDPDGVATKGYWKLQDGLTDSSGNGNDLALSGGSPAASFIDYTGWQWIQIVNTATSAPTTLIIDRRHNLQTGATVDVWRASTTGAGRTLRGSAVVVAGEAVVITGITGGATIAHVIEINDPGNTDGYIEIPLTYLGTVTSLSHGAQLSDAQWSNQVRMQTRETEAGARSGIQVSGDEQYILQATYVPRTDALCADMDLTDQTTLETAIQAGKGGVVPIVFLDEAGVWRNVYIRQENINSLGGSATLFEYPSLELAEVGGGI